MTKTISTSRTTFWLLALGAALLLTFAGTATAARAGHGGDDPAAHNAGDDRAVQAPAGVVLPAAGSDDPASHDANDDGLAQGVAQPATRADDPAGHDAVDDSVAQRLAVAPTVKKSIRRRADDRSARRGGVRKTKHHGESGAHA
jgi:hypothetical protein